MVAPELWIANGFVEVAEGRIVEVGRCKWGMAAKDHGPGVIVPALINAHAHLSLCALAGLAAPGMDFVAWVKKLIETRAGLADEALTRAALRGAEAVRASGTGFIAEVGPVQPGSEAMCHADLEGLLFVEMLGNPAELPLLPESSDGISYSLAGHALHTTAPQALRAMKDALADKRKPFSMHLAESNAETEFLATGSGEWAELLRSRGIDFSQWDIQSESPVERAERLGLLGPTTLAVHVLDVSPKDADILARTATSICVCPRSNRTLHGRMPNLSLFLDRDIKPLLGTDSLASVSTLSLFDEMSFVAENYPDLRPECILSMVSTNGAEALGRPDLGSIREGKQARLLYVDLIADSPEHGASALAWNQGQRVEWI